jgi:hypothetical protein
LATLSISQLEALVGQGRFLEVRDLASRLETTGMESVRKDQLIALSLNKSGASQAALAHLEPLYRANPDEPETAGIMGSIYKELFKKHQDPKYAVLSRDTYAKNFAVTRNYYTGINAATMSAIAGRSKEAREIAAEIIQRIGVDATGYWELATLGEAYLITRQRELSSDHYMRARRMANKDWGKITSVQQQLWLINHYAPVPKDILKAFSPPCVAAFVGHMIDHPQRMEPRFPAGIEEQVKTAIKAAIRSSNTAIGYTSLACGGDILFAEAMIEEEGELHIFLPFDKEDFIRTSVSFAGQHWLDRFESILTSHPPEMVTRESYDGYDELFEFQSKVICGLSVLGSLPHHHEPRLLTVLSQNDLSRMQGGTREMLRWWPFPDKHTNINPDVMHRADNSSDRPTAGQDQTSATIARPLLHMVYADLSKVPPMDLDRIDKALNVNKGDAIVPPRYYRRGPNHVLACYDGETEAIEFAQRIWDVPPVVKNVRNFGIAIHSSPVELSLLAVEEGQAIQTVQKIAALAQAGTICASHHSAALLALHPARYEFGYMGVVQDGSDEVAVYGVSFRE